MKRSLIAVALLALACRSKDIVDDTGPLDTDPASPVDADGDGFAEEADCDDGDPAVNPDAEELCDGIDNDCDGVVDGEGAVDATTFYSDGDRDGHGDPQAPIVACALPPDASPDGDDCDDEDAAVFPGAEELCNDVDDDCDGDTDEPDASDASTWYADADHDGFGDAETSAVACAAPDDHVDDATDCDDGDGAVFPGADELCNAVDDDCDGTVDEPTDLLGSGEDCPASSCQEAWSTLSSSSNGAYWLDAGSGPFEAWCDMDNEGWTLVMRCVEDAIAYDDALWTDTSLLNETDLDFANPGCSKYEAYNQVPFQELRSSATDLSSDFVEDLGTEYGSALALFSATGFEIGQHESYWNDLMDPFGQEWGCTTYRSYGVNQKDYLGVDFINGGAYCDWNGGARWGQRVNADHNGTGNHAGQGWGVYSTIGYDWSYAITQLMWVR